MNNIGFKERWVGKVTILELDSQVRIALKFGASTVSLQRAVQSLLDKGQNQILLNLQGSSYIDANGLGKLVSTYIIVKENGGQANLDITAELLEEILEHSLPQQAIPFPIHHNEFKYAVM